MNNNLFHVLCVFMYLWYLLFAIFKHSNSEWDWIKKTIKRFIKMILQKEIQIIILFCYIDAPNIHSI